MRFGRRKNCSEYVPQAGSGFELTACGTRVLQEMKKTGLAPGPEGIKSAQRRNPLKSLALPPCAGHTAVLPPTAWSAVALVTPGMPSVGMPLSARKMLSRSGRFARHAGRGLKLPGIEGREAAVPPLPARPGPSRASFRKPDQGHAQRASCMRLAFRQSPCRDPSGNPQGLRSCASHPICSHTAGACPLGMANG